MISVKWRTIGHCYYRPYSWKRYALKVLGRYEDNKWLGENGMRTKQCEEEWPVSQSYHGTDIGVTGNIAQEGYDLQRGKRFLHGKGIYTTPSIEVAEKYAHRFKHNGKKY